MNPSRIEVLFTPAEFAALGARDLSGKTCVVFDILRATSTIITALANGAAAVIPVAEIPEALAIRKQRPEVLLAGERHGLRIQATLTGGTDFDLGNSPREFTPEVVRDKTIVLSTTNGSRALRACAGAKSALIGSFLNLRATAGFLEQRAVENLLLVCSGTVDQAAYEDILGAGALANLLWPRFAGGKIADSAHVAREIYRLHQHDLLRALENSRNGRRLRSIPDMRADVDWCVQRDIFGFVAQLGVHGAITRV